MARVFDLIREFPFGTLVGAGIPPWISHLPMILENDSRNDRKPMLLGHMATRNPQASVMPEGADVTAIFHGPHAYITSKWYSENDVPTWNYAVVHAHGRIRWVREFKPLIGILAKMVDVFENVDPDPWRFVLPDDLRTPESLTAAIVGFEIEIESFEAKFKLSQNRSEADRAGVLNGLGARTDEMSRLLLKWMMQA